MLNNSVWEALLWAATTSTAVVALRLHPESKFNVFAALDSTTMHRFLLLKSSQSDLDVRDPLPTGRGFLVRFITTPSDDEGPTCLQLELTDATFIDVFDVIGNDVLMNILDCVDDKTAFRTFVERIAEWQQFLDQLPSQGLSKEAQQGLFGELWFLREFLIGEIGARRAIRAWAGPKALTKDFQFPGLAFEVKTSSAKQHSRFTISSELQLDGSRVGRLILYCMLLETLIGDGMSLPELVATIRDVIRSDLDASMLFAHLLVQSAYADSDAPHYTTRYALRSQHLFDVRDAFPRIVEGDLRIGVGDVHYSILYSECENYEITEDEGRSAIQATQP